MASAHWQSTAARAADAAKTGLGWLEEHVSRGLRAVLAVVLLAVLAGCSPGAPWGGSTPAGGSAARVHDPSAADLRAVEARIAALPGATGATLAFTPKNFSNGAVWEGTITSDATDEAALVTLLKASWKVIWDSADLSSGLLAFKVTGPGDLAVGYRDAGLAANPSGFDLQEMFGPRPTATP